MLNVYGQSDIGLVRNLNEDACNGGVLSTNVAWAVVCDGMGGAKGGNVASAMAVTLISEQILSSYHSDQSNNSVKDLILAAMLHANTSIYNSAKSNESLKGMGTTAVVAVVCDGIAHIVHAGDSRAYIITSDGIQQLTTDHSMVQELVKNGDLTEQEAKVHPQKNIITRALGVQPIIELDYCKHDFSNDSLLLICTDGLTNYVDAEQIYQLSKEYHDNYLAEQLITHAKNAGGGDNITVAIIEN